jgi:hypothetical protein
VEGLNAAKDRSKGVVLRITELTARQTGGGILGI